MRIRAGRAVIFGVLFIFCAPAFVLAESYGNVTVSEVRSIYDGDTFKVSIAGWPAIIGKSISIRVAGIDTPEMRGSCEREKQLAREAKKHTVAFLRGGRVVELRNIERDKYFRIVADVFVDGRNLTQSLLNAGLGYPYGGGTKRKWCY